MKELWLPSAAWWIFLIRGAVVYLAVLLLLRLGGKRQIGQMGAGEFVAIFHDNDIILALREQWARRQEEKRSQQ